MKQLPGPDCILSAHHSGQRECLLTQYAIHLRAIEELQIRVFAQERRRQVEHIPNAIIPPAAHERNARCRVSLAKGRDGKKHQQGLANSMAQTTPDV